MKKILVTGGAGYIGSHTVLELLESNAEVIILDNLVNSNREVIDKLKTFTSKDLTFIQGDVRDTKLLDSIFITNKVDSVIHFAGLKSVSESVANPILYYDNNITGLISIIRAMMTADVKRIVFSSSATVYGDPKELPINEGSELHTTNPYGQTKLVGERILEDLQKSDSSFQVAVLRYFNPVGAHPSGIIGEAPNGTPNNLMPYITQVGCGIREHLNIFGNDYPTSDGTGVRDYIHVVDLARGHLAALEYLQNNSKSITANLGTGKGISVLEMVQTFEHVNKIKIPYKIKDRRPGDVASCYADVTRAERLLKWKAKYNIEDMCTDAWRWQQQSHIK